jgi:rhodanese-related sulfurtransferase
MLAVPELTPTEFCARWPDDRREREVVLLDIREPFELEMAALPFARHVPMREIPAQIADLERTVPLVIMCHSGARSRRVAEFLMANDFDNVFNLKGGIDAWSTEIDPQVPRY